MRVKDLRAAAQQSLRSAAVSPRKLTLLFLLCLYGVNALLIVMDLCAERLIGDGLRAARSWDFYWSLSYVLWIAFNIASILWNVHYNNYYARRLSRGQETSFRSCFLAPFRKAGTSFLTAFFSAMFTSLWALLFMLPGMMLLSACAADVPLTADADALMQGILRSPLFPAAIALCAAALLPTLAVSYRYILAPYLVFDRGLPARAAIRTSKQLMRGHKMELFRLDLSFCVYHLLTFLPGLPSSLEMFGIELIPAQYALAYTVGANIFLFAVYLVWMPYVMTARAHACGRIMAAAYRQENPPFPPLPEQTP